MPSRKPPFADFARRLFIAQKRYELREGRELDRAGLGEVVGLSDSTVSNWFTGKQMPSVVQLEMIARLLGVHPGWLAFGEVTEITGPEGEEPPASPSPPSPRRRR